MKKYSTDLEDKRYGVTLPAAKCVSSLLGVYLQKPLLEKVGIT